MFPNKKSIEESGQSGLEEERRLAYVALTRAEKKVYLSYANARRRFGGMPIPCIQSRFLHELPVELVDHIGQSTTKMREKKAQEKKSAYKIATTKESYSIGMQVVHKLFGKGKILAVEGAGDTAKLTILFSGNTRKKLIVKYAKLSQL